MTSRYHERFARMESVLLIENEQIDIGQLRTSCKYGVTDVFRPLAWRLLLEYLPLKRSEWPSYLQKQRETYSALVDDLIVHPGQSSTNPSESTFIDDHPLSLNESSEWRSYFKDNEVLLQIDKDVRRLCPEMQFFQQKTAFPHKSAAKLNLSKRIRHENLECEIYDNSYNNTSSFLPSPSKVSLTEYANDISDEEGEYHWQVVERILFIYSKLNPGVKYVQGMNEVLGPVYYVLASDGDAEWAEFGEADAYYCFQLLMSDIKDNFIKTLDRSTCGIVSLMDDFHSKLLAYDPELHTHLVSNLGIKPPFYAFRWLSLLLSQEFPLPDVITIWDSVFASSNRLEMIQWVCLAMLERQRNALMNGDFSTNLRILQNYNEADVGQLVVQSYEMQEAKGGGKRLSVDEGNRTSDSAILTSSAKIAAALSNAVKSFSKR